MLTLCAWPFYEWLCPNIQTCHLQKIDLPRKISGIELFKQENRSFSEQKCTEKVNFLPSTKKKVVQNGKTSSPTSNTSRYENPHRPTPLLASEQPPRATHLYQTGTRHVHFGYTFHTQPHTYIYKVGKEKRDRPTHRDAPAYRKHYEES